MYPATHSLTFRKFLRKIFSFTKHYLNKLLASCTGMCPFPRYMTNIVSNLIDFSWHISPQENCQLPYTCLTKWLGSLWPVQFSIQTRLLIIHVCLVVFFLMIIFPPTIWSRNMFWLFGPPPSIHSSATSNTRHPPTHSRWLTPLIPHNLQLIFCFLQNFLITK